MHIEENWKECSRQEGRSGRDRMPSSIFNTLIKTLWNKLCQFTCAELRKEDRIRAPCIRIKTKCCFKSAVSVSYITMFAQLLCLLVFFIDWPFKQYKPTPEMITLPVPLYCPWKYQNHRMLLSTSASWWSSLSWLDKMCRDTRKCIFSFTLWAGSPETSELFHMYFNEYIIYSSFKRIKKYTQKSQNEPKKSGKVNKLNERSTWIVYRS